MSAPDRTLTLFAVISIVSAKAGEAAETSAIAEETSAIDQFLVFIVLGIQRFE